MSLFTKNLTPKEQMREQQKILRRAQRDLDRDKRDLDRQEKQLELEIKKAAKRGDKTTCTILAKQLVQVRKQKTRNITAGSKILGVSAQTKSIQANASLASAMSKTSKTMAAVNKQMKPEQVMKTMQDFEKESTKMGMAEEIVDDTLNGILDESGDEEEQEAIVTQVLDEIGIEISGKMSEAPSAHHSKLGESSKVNLPTDDEIEKQLAKLKM
ncbi:charged multivesicular body protein 2b-like [Centruroides sculpturatus]|uniref:charged multivesicular body protein 2b-like n=1 Tax=Centruroides sculpturatus TaxID=218467 RepID=UPI000C6CE989|nr:charged multivesicular body protein 2b-like [Centruroides sculpturatus]